MDVWDGRFVIISVEWLGNHLEIYTNSIRESRANDEDDEDDDDDNDCENDVDDKSNPFQNWDASMYVLRHYWWIVSIFG